ncbi:hypothetical protein E2C01_071100 [Portunus trituberculatus]|uniref:Uncharacterized protein n=1 Tax=Portunus trituberculatus TaxID=210409 RepID=A0A5B7I3Y6_PORTR|nr:hypothetical protein [Portunus trituberculatus]
MTVAAVPPACTTRMIPTQQRAARSPSTRNRQRRPGECGRRWRRRQWQQRRRMTCGWSSLLSDGQRGTSRLACAGCWPPLDKKKQTRYEPCLAAGQVLRVGRDGAGHRQGRRVVLSCCRHTKEGRT